MIIAELEYYDAVSYQYVDIIYTLSLTMAEPVLHKRKAISIETKFDSLEQVNTGRINKIKLYH